MHDINVTYDITCHYANICYNNKAIQSVTILNLKSIFFLFHFSQILTNRQMIWSSSSRGFLASRGQSSHPGASALPLHPAPASNLFLICEEKTILNQREGRSKREGDEILASSFAPWQLLEPPALSQGFSLPLVPILAPRVTRAWHSGPWALQVSGHSRTGMDWHSSSTHLLLSALWNNPE